MLNRYYYFSNWSRHRFLFSLHLQKFPGSIGIELGGYYDFEVIYEARIEDAYFFFNKVVTVKSY